MIMNNKHISVYLLFFSFLLLQSPLSSAIEFIFNSFNSSSVSLYGNATIQSNILTLTNSTPNQIGLAVYPHKIPTKSSSSLLSFSTSFIFAMVPTRNILPGHGFVFLFTPVTGIQNAAGAQYLGLFDRTVDGSSSNHVFGVEFDVFRNEEFQDIHEHHVGIDVNSVTSVISVPAQYYDEIKRDFKTLQLNDGRNYQVWINYRNFYIDVSMAPVGMKPGRCLICTSLNLSEVFEDEMYVGFTAATGTLAQSHKILSWSFSNSNFSLSDDLITEGLPSFVPPDEPIYRSTGFIVGLMLGIFFVAVTFGVARFLWIKRNRRLAEEKVETEEEYFDLVPGMPTRFSYEELKTATENFNNKLGEGGFGSVFKGTLKDGSKIAVKCLEGLGNVKKSFLAEVQSIGSIHHLCLVRLRGFCARNRNDFLSMNS